MDDEAVIIGIGGMGDKPPRDILLSPQDRQLAQNIFEACKALKGSAPWQDVIGVLDNRVSGMVHGGLNSHAYPLIRNRLSLITTIKDMNSAEVLVSVLRDTAVAKDFSSMVTYIGLGLFCEKLGIEHPYTGTHIPLHDRIKLLFDTDKQLIIQAGDAEGHAWPPVQALQEKLMADFNNHGRVSRWVPIIEEAIRTTDNKAHLYTQQAFRRLLTFATEETEKVPPLSYVDKCLTPPPLDESPNRA